MYTSGDSSSIRVGVAESIMNANLYTVGIYLKSFRDLEDALIDADFSENEIEMVLKILSEVELAALIRSHPPEPEIAAVDLPEAEMKLRSCLQSYLESLEDDRAKRIIEITDLLQ